MTTISAIIATRDRGALIRGTLESILRGDRLPDEILVLDQSRGEDRASEEAVAAVARSEEFRDTAKRCSILYRRSATQGLSRARNEGIALSRGAVIAFTDDDVVVHEDWLDRAAAEFDAYPDLALAFGSVEPPGEHDWRTEKVPYTLVPTRRPVRLFAPDSLGVMGANMFLRRSGFEALGPFDERLGAGTSFAGFEDTEYLLRALSQRPPLRVHTLGEARVVHHAGARRGEEYRRFVRAMYGTGMGRFWAYLLRQRRPAYLLRFFQEEAGFLDAVVCSLVRGRKPRGVATHMYRWSALLHDLVVPSASTSSLSGQRRCSAARENRMDAYRFAFVMDQQVGLKTEALNMERLLEKDVSIAPTFVPVLYGAGRASGWEGTLEGVREIRRGLGDAHRFDAVLWATWAAKTVPDLIDAAPAFLRMDMTPAQMEEMGGQYGYSQARGRFLGPIKRRATERLYRQAHRLFPWSRYAAHSLTGDYGVPPEKITVISPGTDIERFHPAEAKGAFEDGTIRILFVGGDFLRKGGDTLVQWATQRSGGESRVEVHLVTRDDAAPADLASQGIIVHRGIDNNSDALVRLYQRCDIFALPTRADCYSLAALEAMACGLPVVITDIGGISDIVQDGQTGFLVPPGDDTTLAACLNTLIASASLRATFGKAGRLRAEREFDHRVCLGRLLGAMKEATSS